jgi:hypothetical protein
MRVNRLSAAALACSVLALFNCGSNTQAPAAPSAAPATTTFDSTLSPGGSASRTFTASQAGTVTVTLTGLGSAQPVGLGLGVPSGGVAHCSLGTSVLTIAGASPQITAPVDAGTYCAAVFDPGDLADTVGFQMSIVSP